MREPEPERPSTADAGARSEDLPPLPTEVGKRTEGQPVEMPASDAAGASGSGGDGGVPQPVHETRGPNEIALGGVLLAVVVGLALVGQDHWRRGLLLAGIGLLAGAAVRLVLPARLAGLLVVRGRVFDAVVLAVLGASVIVLTSSVPLPVGSG